MYVLVNGPRAMRPVVAPNSCLSSEFIGEFGTQLSVPTESAPSVSSRIRADPPPPQAGQEGILLTRETGEVARCGYAA